MTVARAAASADPPARPLRVALRAIDGMDELGADGADRGVLEEPGASMVTSPGADGAERVARWTSPARGGRAW